MRRYRLRCGLSSLGCLSSLRLLSQTCFFSLARNSSKLSLFGGTALGRAAGVPTPVIDSVIILTGGLLGVDFTASGRSMERLGIQDRKIRSGDMFVAIGAFDLPGSKPAYKFLPGRDADVLRLEWSISHQSFVP